MTEASVSIEQVSKRYRIGAMQHQYATLRDRLAGMFRRRERTDADTELWALRDISFEIPAGEALGLIGHNGAGKSTLLKILSRITEPTEGRAILRGRVASLLEVGTGFHPELTGRENIFLNGAILGMSRAEIVRNFDAIVAFAEVERFLDTPVKRYSSGMYVRLAFAIAAHLTPEILLVDEVLAVGDIEFQRRCLGRMNEVARSGRTVVFVSHNLASIEALCTRAVLLERGAVEISGTAREVVAHYLSRGSAVAPSVDLRNVPNREGSGRATVTRMEILNAGGTKTLDQIGFRESFRIRMHYDAHEAIPAATAGLAVLDDRGERVFTTNTLETGVTIDTLSGTGVFECAVKAPNILPGVYRLELWITDVLGRSFADHLFSVHGFDVVVGDWRGGSVADLTYDRRGVIYLDCEWALDPQ
jgi:lipopolysaccharide transport system ATP-binding protein